ncbi:transcriptional regulator MraZ [Kordiimonas sediminis]|uniref:Transcriptional regulator MraZ n=1 Tax=Kordiimonas sediminis TaxID=1735581 RepID=A0A919ARX9_9PROT|nr:hypothetical protein [Kordiimonas sediminis]GHF23080.1 transcriptional regulator MraZ [Kordiimonas sediminis]
MAFFLSTFTNKIDKKGRVSVPSTFRTTVAASGSAGIVLYKPMNLECLEGADEAFLVQLSDKLYGDFGPFSPDQMSIATTILGGAKQLGFDPEGRVVIPQDLCEFAGIKDKATFVGIGRKFQIWDPDKFEMHREEQFKIASEKAPGMQPFGGGGQV